LAGDKNPQKLLAGQAEDVLYHKPFMAAVEEDGLGLRIIFPKRL
jgi:hypothetical protein